MTYTYLQTIAEIPAKGKLKLPIRIRLLFDNENNFYVDIRKYRPASTAGKQDFYLSGIMMPVSNIDSVVEAMDAVADAVREMA